MLKHFAQMAEQEFEDIGEVEYGIYYDEGLFQQLGKVNQPPD